MSDLPIIGDIRKEWEWVQPGIEEIMAEQPQLTFRPEDVYAACVNEQATLFTQKGITGNNFAVTYIEVNKYSGDKILLIWLARLDQRGNKAGVKLMEFFDQVARDCGCAFIEARSPIESLGEHFLKHGWDLDTRIYTRKV
tara:strand:+ start:149 stop:568 length:420 start_codon:yes stop_codon:yes gene_type:complete